MVFHFSTGCTSESESLVSWASDFSNLTSTASHYRDENSFPNGVRTWSRQVAPQRS